MTPEPAWNELADTLRAFVARRVDPPEDVDDLVQTTLERALAGHPRLERPERLSAWVHRIARRAIADHYRARSRARRRLAPLDPELAAPPPATAGDEDRPAEVVAALLPLFLGRLPEPYREALAWTELDGLTQAEAAARAGISLPGMKSRVQRGRRMLEAELTRCCSLALDARRKVIGCTPKGECSRCD